MRIWDAPTRLFHWLLVALMGAAWWTAENEALEWHLRIGMAILVLLLFRLAWGLIGGSTARFSGFVRRPVAILAYLRGRSPPDIGHSPLAALGVIALLGASAAEVALGLGAIDEDGIAPGPLSHLLSEEAVEVATELHEHEAFDLLLVLVALHVAAILFYALVKRRNLVGPMIIGKGRVVAGAEPLRAAPAWRAWAALGFAFGVAWWVWEGAPPL